MKLKTCILCGKDKAELIHIGVRGGGANVLRCCTCGLIRLSEIYDDMDKFYESSGMYDGREVSLTELRKECEGDDDRRMSYTYENIKNRILLDYGCGAGGYLKKAEIVAKKVYGVEINKYVRDSLNNQGLEVVSDIEMISENIDVITMFHVLEHLVNPVEMLQRISNHLSPNGELIIEVPNADDALLSLYKCDAFADFTYWCCHVYLYNRFTLCKLIEKSGLKVNYIKHIQRYSLANHLYWLSQGKPGGHKIWKMLDDKELKESYEKKLADMEIADTIICSVSK